MSITHFALALAFVPLLTACVNPMYSAAERAETAEYLRKVRDPATYYAMDCETFLATKRGYDQYPSMAADPVNLVIQQVARERDCSASSVPAPSVAIAPPTAVTPLAAPAPVTAQTGTLGLHVTAVTPTVVQQFGLPTVSGVLVLGPVPGSGAEKAGMLAGDIILEIAGTQVNSPSELTAITSRIRPGFTAPLKVWRYRAAIDVLVEVGDSSSTAQPLAPQPAAAAGQPPSPSMAAPIAAPAGNSATNTSFCLAMFEAKQVQGLGDYPPRGLITQIWQGPGLSTTPARLTMPEFQAFTRLQGYNVAMQPMFCQPIGTIEQCQALGSEDFMLTMRSFSAVVACTETSQDAKSLRANLLKQWPYLQASTWRPIASQ
ncbi:S1C family serine protease [Pseudomonas peli]|uniref:S1C family serine protease n=1 Tax=Pseudomonas peli TaxID=592361 RepID=UPI003D31D827